MKKTSDTIEDLEFKNKPIKIFVRENKIYNYADYYYEEIRKELFSQFGQDKLFSEGLIIKTSIDTNLQSMAEQSLINGLLSYDKKQGWRGPLSPDRPLHDLDLAAC